MKRFCALLWLAGLTGMTSNVYATVKVIDYWRMGENDPGAVSGAACTNTLDLIGGRTLTNTPVGGLYPVYTNNVGAQAALSAGSRLGLALSGGQHGTGALIPNITDNFGIELWVCPADTNGGKVVVYNGNTGLNGWGIYQSGSAYYALFAGILFWASAPTATNTWTHLALVRNSGTATFYANGVSAGTLTIPPNTPAGSFLLGCNNSSGRDLQRAH